MHIVTTVLTLRQANQSEICIYQMQGRKSIKLEVERASEPERGRERGERERKRESEE